MFQGSFSSQKMGKQEAGMNSYMLAIYSDDASLHSWTTLIKSPVKGCNFFNKKCVTRKITHCLFK